MSKIIDNNPQIIINGEIIAIVGYWLTHQPYLLNSKGCLQAQKKNYIFIPERSKFF